MINQKKPLVDAATLQPATIDTVLPLERLTVTDMSADWMPPACRDLVEAAHASLNIPRVMMIAAITCSLAAAVQGKAKVRVGPAWTENLSIWWLVFCSSASMKSKCVDLATSPLLAYQRRLDEETKMAANMARAKKKELEGRLNAIIKKKSELKKGFGSSEDANAVEYDLRETVQQISDHVIPTVPRLIKTDITPAMVSKRLNKNFEADGYARLAIIADEAAFLMNMLGRHNSKEGAVLETILAGWDGGHVSEDRRGETAKDIVEANIDHAHITLCCIVQPSVLDKMNECEDLSARGFFGRCLLHHTAGGKLPPFGTPDIPKPVLEAYSAMVTRLLEWEPEDVPYEVDMLVHWDLLEETYDRVRLHEQDEDEHNSAWLRRAIGRSCRVAALYRLASTIGCGEPVPTGVAASIMSGAGFGDQVRNSPTRPGSGGGSGGRGGLVRENQILQYLLSCIFNDLAFMQTVERPTESTGSLAVRTLHSLSRRGKLQVGQVFRGRYLSKLLKQNMTIVNQILDALEETGHIVKVEERANRRGPAAAEYRVQTLDPMGSDRPKPTAVQSVAEPLDSFLDSLAEPDYEPEPEPVEESLGADPAEDWTRE
jgi:hypothetical protein